MPTATIHRRSTTAAPSPTGRILVVDDHRDARESLTDVLRHAGHQVDAVSSGVEALPALARESYDVLLTDLMMPGMSGLELLAQLQSRPHGAQIIMITAHATVATAVEAMRRGAFDYLEKPFSAPQIEGLVARALQHGALEDKARRVSTAASGAVAMIGESVATRQLRDRIAQVAATDETVLIHGESGTGKELVARSIHAASLRASATLVRLNCPVLSAHLMESELFGHERGAFTGADAPRTGRFELADQGTILLDEVTEIAPSLQAKLLRVLQEREFERVGSSTTIQIDVRVLATTNRDLLEEVESGAFRRDLYYRLAVVPIQVAPLRDRRDDIAALVAHFAALVAARLHRDPVALELAAHDLLLNYAWPGNVRELENIITRASVLSTNCVVRADDLRPWLIASTDGPSCATTCDAPIGLSLNDMERKLIEATLSRFGGHRAKTAEALGIGIRTLSGKLREYGYAPRTKDFARSA